jgi:hypothetical protein
VNSAPHRVSPLLAHSSSPLLFQGWVTWKAGSHGQKALFLLQVIQQNAQRPAPLISSTSKPFTSITPSTARPIENSPSFQPRRRRTKEDDETQNIPPSFLKQLLPLHLPHPLHCPPGICIAFSCFSLAGQAVGFHTVPTRPLSSGPLAGIYSTVN